MAYLEGWFVTQKTLISKKPYIISKSLQNLEDFLSCDISVLLHLTKISNISDFQMNIWCFQRTVH